MQESSLHAALKNYYTLPGDQQEVPVGGYLIDVLSGDMLIEIQTGNFSAMKSKLPALLEQHPVLLVHPIAVEKWIVRLGENGKTIESRRKSPRRGKAVDVFWEMVRIPHLINHPNFALEVLLVRAEELRRNDGKGSWRRGGWSIADHRLLEVVDRIRFRSADDFRKLLPAGLEQPFTTRQLAKALGIRVNQAGKMVYCLRSMNVLIQTGKLSRSYLYMEILHEEKEQPG
jgi:hypothetical protein